MLKSKIDAILSKEFNDFDSALLEARNFVENNFTALNRPGNSIVVNLEKIDVNALKLIIGNYAAFSQDAIHMLVDAMMRCHDWPLLFEELQENINEEKGAETKGIPHLEIMREGYRKDLGLEVDFQYFDVSKVTQNFLHKMRVIFNNDDNAFIAGALIAFEGTAIEEFYIIDLIIKRFMEVLTNSKDPISNLPESLTKYYIDGHKIFEIGHEEHLINSIKPYIDKTNTQRMVRGYITAAMTMNNWWEQLYLEGNFNSNYEHLQSFEQQMTSVFKSIFKD